MVRGNQIQEESESAPEQGCSGDKTNSEELSKIVQSSLKEYFGQQSNVGEIYPRFDVTRYYQTHTNPVSIASRQRESQRNISG